MKRHLFIGFMFGLVLLSACTHHSDNLVETQFIASPTIVASPEMQSIRCSQLQAIDSLMWQRPDSALVVLLEYLNDDGRDVARHVSTDETFDNHYANLLLAELLYKNDYAQTNRTALSQAVPYFDSITSILNDHPHASWRHGGLEPPSPERNDNLIFLDARAHYINGVGYYEHDSMVEACKEYLKALEVMENHFKESELVEEKAQFVAYTYTRLTDLFSDLYLHEQTIYFARRSMDYYRMQNTVSWYGIHMFNEIGSQYDMMEQLDSAALYYRKAINTLDDTTTLVYRDISAHLIYLEYKEGSCQADTAVKRLHQLLQSSESERENQVRYQYIGEIFYHEKMYDSAWIYLNEGFKNTSVVGLKRQAAEWLVEICKIQDWNDSILEYANFLAPFANQEENKSEIKSQLTELYKAFSQGQQARQHQEEMLQHRKRLITIVFGWSLATLVGIVFFYYFSKRRKQHYENQMAAERQTHKMQRAALAGRLKRSNAALKEQDKTTFSISPFSFAQQPNGAESYAEEPICREIIAVCNDKSNPIKSTVPVSAYASIALTDSQKAELKKAVMAHYAPLFEMLKERHPELKEKDFMYCYLCLLGLDNMQIAVMLQLSLSTIWDREKRLKKILGSEDRVAVVLHGLLIG